MGPVLTQEPEAHCAGLKTDTQALLPVFFIFFLNYTLLLSIIDVYFYPPKYMDLECHSVCAGQHTGIFAYLLYFICLWKKLISKKV